MRYNYTDKEIKVLLKSIVILSDTREQTNGSILNFFKEKKIEYKVKKLDFGDYSFYIPKNDLLSIGRDIYFDKDIVVERKGLSELAGNLTADRERFEKELIRKKDAKFYLMVENGSWDKIHDKAYRSGYAPKSFIATLNTYMARYNISVDFISRERAGEFIYLTLYYFAREVLKNYMEVNE